MVDCPPLFWADTRTRRHRPRRRAPTPDAIASNPSVALINIACRYIENYLSTYEEHRFNGKFTESGGVRVVSAFLLVQIVTGTVPDHRGISNKRLNLRSVPSRRGGGQVWTFHMKRDYSTACARREPAKIEDSDQQMTKHYEIETKECHSKEKYLQCPRARPNNIVSVANGLRRARDKYTTSTTGEYPFVNSLLKLDHGASALNFTTAHKGTRKRQSRRAVVRRAPPGSSPGDPDALWPREMQLDAPTIGTVMVPVRRRQDRLVVGGR
ncbi:hypothetical protein EVAR_80395_1 [Eumeta japonica]|uniref:Uncharacterized protein n=1 Tax=Eumeta variegata TaxID=151549 RepID=A0A4C1VHI5_EUMVA|nr:hypothetical protein EVAR_80395_1 [Eumeta japonica]